MFMSSVLSSNSVHWAFSDDTSWSSLQLFVIVFLFPDQGHSGLWPVKVSCPGDRACADMFGLSQYGESSSN